MARATSDPVAALQAIGAERRAAFEALGKEIATAGDAYKRRRRGAVDRIRELYGRGATLAALARAAGESEAALRVAAAPLPAAPHKLRSPFSWPDPELTAAIEAVREAHPDLPLAELATQVGIPYAVLARGRSRSVPLPGEVTDDPEAAAQAVAAEQLAAFVEDATERYDARVAARVAALEDLRAKVEVQVNLERSGKRTEHGRVDAAVLTATQRVWQLGASIQQDITPALAPLNLSHQSAHRMVDGVKSDVPEKRRGRYDRPLHIADLTVTAAIYNAAAGGLSNAEIQTITTLGDKSVQRALSAEAKRRGRPARPRGSQRAKVYDPLPDPLVTEAGPDAHPDADGRIPPPNQLAMA